MKQAITIIVVFLLGIGVGIGVDRYVLKDGGTFTAPEIFALLIGMAVAFAVSIFVIKFLMDYIKKHDFKVFGWYRIVLGALVLLYFGIKAIAA